MQISCRPRSTQLPTGPCTLCVQILFVCIVVVARCRNLVGQISIFALDMSESIELSGKRVLLGESTSEMYATIMACRQDVSGNLLARRLKVVVVLL